MTWGLTDDARPKRIYVVECKNCRRHIPAGVTAFPRDNIRVDCPLCGEKRRFRPNEVYLGWPDQTVLRQQVQRAEYYRRARPSGKPVPPKQG